MAKRRTLKELLDNQREYHRTMRAIMKMIHYQGKDKVLENKEIKNK